MPTETAIAPDFVPAATVICDSVSPAGTRLTTLEVRIHRFVLAEFNTHRTFSRNSASSRAIPVTRTIARVQQEPVYPLSWPAERKGMQGGDELDTDLVATARAVWDWARVDALAHAKKLTVLGVHKSVVNRLLEPFLPHTIVVTATEWDGFWQQRCSELAQPEIRAAAQAMHTAYTTSQPVLIERGRWHLPYIQPQEREEYSLYLLRRVAVARCARVSYLTHDGTRDITADLDLYERLTLAEPPHASPFEHVATPTMASTYDNPGNFKGWLQLRHMALGR
jgi:thymidylate synthase ThyX